jgi:hypothetical protein
MTSTETLFGQPLNPNNIRWSNLWNNAAGVSMFAPTGFNPQNGQIGCPDGKLHPFSAINYLRNKRNVIFASAQQRPMVRLGDKNLKPVGELTGEMSMEYEELMVDSGTARYVVRYDNWLVDYMVNLTRIEEDLHLIIDSDPNNPTDCRKRWGGKIHTINIQRNDDGTSTVELLAISNREHAKRLLFAATPFSAPEFQPLKMWIAPGPTRSVLFASGMVNLARLFVPGLSFITNLFNPLSWLNPLNSDALFQVNPLDWPIQFAFVNTALDQSNWTVLGATWTDWHSATQDILKDSGCMLRAYTYLVGDTYNPYDEELSPLLGLSQNVSVANSPARPTRNCVIFACLDKSGHQGPTGGVWDGLLNVIGLSLDDFLSSTLIDANTGLALDGEPIFDVNGNNVPIFESLLGTAPPLPKVIWREGQFTGLNSATHTLHKGSPKTLMTGGRSPTLVNEIQTFAIKWALSQLQDMINVGIGTIINTAFQMPMTPGLDEMYQGQADNIMFAWERVTDPLRAIWNGDLSWQEYFERGSSTAYTLSGLMTIETARFKTRAFHGFKAEVRNGWPWILDEDTELGDRNVFEFDGALFVDQITATKRSVDRQKGLKTGITIGEDKDKDDPMARTMRAVQAMYTMFGAFLGEGILFG